VQASIRPEEEVRMVVSAYSNVTARRRFLKLVATSGAATGVAMFAPGLLRAADLPHLDASDPTAKALGYVEDASATTDAKHKAGDACANCQFYSGGPAGYGPCQIFAGKSVSAKGWCVSHSPRK
jgi:hypothetical protein